MLRPHLRRPAAAVAALIAVLAAGCSSAGGSSGAVSGPPEKPNLTVAAVPTNDSAGLYIADQRGYFAQQGLHIKIVPAVSSATVISSQLAGKIDVSIGNYVSYIRAAALQGAKLRVIAGASVMGPNIQMILVPPGSHITSVSQLKGKSIAVNVKDNIGTLLIDSVLNNNAILPAASGVKFVPIDFPFMAKALQDHKVAAAWMPEPFVTQAEESIGAQPLADTNQGTTENLPIGGYVVTQAWAKKYPRTLAAFLRALEEGQRVADSDPPAVVKAVEKFTGVPASTAEIVSSPTFPLGLDPQSIQRVANLMLQFNLLPKGFNTSQMTG